MKTYIALFRGINVGGNNRLPMKELVSELEKLGCDNVRTYIQSGNVVLQSKDADATKLAGKIGSAIKKRHGFKPWVLLLTLADLKKAAKANPFPEGEADPKSLHLNFLEAAPEKPDLKKLDAIKRPSERYRLKGRVFYLHAPDGIARSKLAANVEKVLGVPMTGRNWRTVSKLLELATT